MAWRLMPRSAERRRAWWVMWNEPTCTGYRVDMGSSLGTRPAFAGTDQGSPLQVCFPGLEGETRRVRLIAER